LYGYFLTFEGIEGCGKTTQVQLLCDRLKQMGVQYLLTREPGDGEMGGKIRELLLSVSSKMDAQTELFLLAADRTRHIIEIVRPALEKGLLVISDRYTDSSLAYQGYGRGLSLDFIRAINEKATDGIFPDKTLVLNLTPDVSIKRSRKRLKQQDMFEAEGRFEQESLDFHSRVRNGYLEIAEREPERVKLVDASLPIDKLSDEIWTLVLNELKKWEKRHLND